MSDNLPSDSHCWIESLLSPACYDETVERVELMETHLSWVLLTGKHAYKIKKPVDFGFVDFTTLARRKFFCDEELRLNGRLAPQMYLEVVPITGTPDDPHIGGDEQPLEYAVKMRQFPQEALLNHVIENGALRAEHIDKLAEVIADFHQRAAVAKPNGETNLFGTKEVVLRAVWDNFRALFDQELDAEGRLIGNGELSTEFHETEEILLAWTRSQADRLSARFEERRREGAVRECHGDMHLGNLLLEHDEIVIFDGIEFNENLRWIDVSNEVAFCMMDLMNFDRPDLAHRLMNAYLERTGDFGGLDVLPFYLTYRALVRAKVAHLGCKQHEDEEPDCRKALAAQRREYLDLATRFTQPRHPLLIITHGLSGSGKSFATQALVESVGAVRARSDVERKRLAGLTPQERSNSSLEGDLYSAASSEATYRRLAECGEQIVNAGFPAILDATFLKAEQRTTMRNLAERLEVSFVILDFQATDDQLRERVTQRLKQGADSSEANLDVLDHQLNNRDILETDEAQFVIPVNTNDPNFADQLFEGVMNFH